MGAKITLNGLQLFRFKNTSDYEVTEADVEKAFGRLRTGLVEFEGRGRAYYEGDPIVSEDGNDIVIGLVNIKFETSGDKIGLGLMSAIDKENAEKVILGDISHILRETVIKPATKYSQDRRGRERDVA